MSMINEFKDEYFFLSNMYPRKSEKDEGVDENFRVEFEGIVYKTSEAAFQAAKYDDVAIKQEFANLTGNQAKYRGGPNGPYKLSKEEVKIWNNKRIDIMREVLKAKFTQNPELAKKLIDTGDEEIIEGRSFRPDKFWGVNLKNGQGDNHLGKLLMEIRDYLKK